MAPARRTLARWSEAVALLEAQSPDIRNSTDAIVQADGAIRIAIAGALPTASFEGSAIHNFITAESSIVTDVDANGNPVFSPYVAPTPTYVSGTLDVKVPVLAVQAWRAIGTARLSKQVAQLSAGNARRTAMLGLASAVVGVLTAEQVARVNRDALASAEERLKLAAARAAAGGGTAVDVVRMRQDVSAARRAVATGDEALHQAREALGAALVAGEEVGVARSFEVDGLTEGASSRCAPLADISQRQDVLGARARVDVAAHRVTEIDDQYLPVVSLQSDLQTTTLDTGAAPHTVWSVQANLTIPIWDGGARYGLRRSAKATEDIAARQERATVQAATIEVSHARRAARAAAELRAIAIDAQADAVELERVTRQAFSIGQGTSLELVGAASALRQAETSLAIAEYEVLRTKLAELLSMSRC